MRFKTGVDGTDNLGSVLSPDDQDPEARQRARLVVCGYAKDVADATLLLHMLGLDS